MSNDVIKEITTKTKANKITWFSLVSAEGYHVGYYMRRENKNLQIRKVDGFVLKYYEVLFDLDRIDCGRMEGRKLYRAIEKSRTDVLEG